MIDADAIRMRYEAVAGHLDERGLRLFAASEARAAGRGGIALVSQLTGIARSTIGRGLKDLDREAAEWPHGLIRRDSVAPASHCVVICATNHPELLDRAVSTAL